VLYPVLSTIMQALCILFGTVHKLLNPVSTVLPSPINDRRRYCVAQHPSVTLLRCVRVSVCVCVLSLSRF